MILSGQDIKNLGLLLDADDENMQTQGWDVRVEEVYRVVNKPFGEKITPEDYVDPYTCEEDVFGGACIARIIAGSEDNGGDNDHDVLYYFIPGFSSVLFKLVETVDLTPKDGHLFNAFVLPKSSLSRRGIEVHSAWWDAGYKGSGVVLVKTSEVPLKIKPGDAFGQMIFYEGSPTSQTYNGQYQGEGIKSP